VVVALVLHGDLDVFPTHIEDRDDLPVFVTRGDLGLWRRESRADEKQSQPCLAGRLGARVDQGQGTTGTSDAAAALVTLCEQLDVGNLEVRHMSERIDGRYRLADGIAASKVESRPCRICRGHARDQLNFVVCKPI
jgi:hypothetical protein